MYCFGGFNYLPLSEEEIRKDRSQLFKPKRAVKTFQNGARLICDVSRKGKTSFA